MPATKLLILGAGCSCDFGYPLAADTKVHLSKFATDIENTCPKLAELTRNTLKVFDALQVAGFPADTLDDLIWNLDQSRLHDRSNYRGHTECERAKDEARVTIAAMFRAKERPALNTGLGAYRKLLRRLFGNDPDPVTALERSRWRVLSFNYDGLFELAFCRHYNFGQNPLYGSTLLNSGLDACRMNDVAKIDPSRFSFLKLHGSVSFEAWNDGPFGLRHEVKPPDAAKNEIASI